jgi:superfamily II DNA or RNA helicase
MVGGLEWTVKFSQVGDGSLFEHATAHFETLWNDTEFQSYNPNNVEQVLALDRALKNERGDSENGAITWFGVEPKPYQIELLDRLEAERRHGRTRNLLVAATGTGKTVVAAFDYRRICENAGGRPKILYIAHRKEILAQSRRMFAQVLHDPGFGVLLADGDDPGNYEHCFATIQSVLSKGLVDRCGVGYWHMVIVDECHHAAAASYDQVLTQLQPAILLGLTATPERADGKNILSLFDCRPDGGPAAELRLWQALDQQLLSPFEYYGCADDTDLSRIPWDKADERTALDQILTGNHVRALTAISAFHAYVANPRKARALAFCVSVSHAEFMAEEFVRAGIPAEAVTGQTSKEQRRSAPTRLALGEVTVLCTCDLYNEGIDIPSVDTLLFLRPTQSPIIFQQQLGRGLRLYDKKESCVVIDLVGRHREEFRFDRLLAVLTGLPRAAQIEQVQHGFCNLPPGCHIQLDRISRQQVLGNLQRIAMQRWSMLARELASYAALPGKANVDMGQFLADQGLDLAMLYPDRGMAPSGWTALRRQAGLLRGDLEPFEVDMGRRLHDLLHHEDRLWLSCAQRVAEGRLAYNAANSSDQRRIDQLSAQLFPNRTDPCTGTELSSRIALSPTVGHELAQLVTILDEASDLADLPVPGVPLDWPLCLHARYTLRELMLAIGWIKPNQRHVPPAGVLPLHQLRIELLLITLDKSAGFTSRTAYHDYAISPELFHWQSQNSCTPATAAGKRYLHGASEGWTFQLFVRETKGDAYRALGPGVLVDAKGERPMSITWKLHNPLPAVLFRKYSVLRDA